MCLNKYVCICIFSLFSLCIQEHIGTTLNRCIHMYRCMHEHTYMYMNVCLYLRKRVYKHTSLRIDMCTYVENQ